MKNKQKQINRLKALLAVVSIFVICLFGGLMNGLAILENDCKMPVLALAEYTTDTHQGFTNKSTVNFYYLTDIIPIQHYMVSIGDIFLISSILLLFLLIGYVSLQYKRGEL
ncbi:DUF5317 domain-containing protein [Candidatus Dojkabacteria bacterium]|jgi:hypothetical protein|nr:DUF5317 domain-containing protein [Candidatus Dojkabacteria bacterium]